MRKPKNLTPRVLLAGATLLASFVASTPALADYPATVISQNPVGYWRLNETTPVANLNSTATNLGTGGAVLNGTYQGDLAGRGAVGAVTGDKAASFDGSSEYVNVVPDPAYAINPAEFTVECWFAPAGAGGTTAILSCGDFTSARRGWLVYQATLGQVQFRSYNGANTTATTLNLNTNMTVGQYYHLTVTRSNTTFLVYINGVLMNSGIPSAYAGPFPGDNFTIGVRATPYAFPWAGKVDEVAYYTNHFTADQIAAHYAAATSNAVGYAAQILADHPLLYYRLDEPALPITANSGSLGAAAVGKMIYPAVSGVAGPSSPTFPGFESGNVGVSFSGASASKAAGGYVSVPALHLNTNGVTMTGWIKPNGPQAKSAGALMVRSKLTAPDNGTSAGLVFDSAGGLNLSYNWDGDDNTINFVSGQGLTDGAWNFAALIVRPDQAIIYAPGVNADPSTNVHTHAVLPFDGATYFGTDPAASGLNGALDEVAIFNRALSVGEVYSQYADAVGGLAPKIFTSPQTPAGNLYAGDSLTLTVDAGGTGPITYQWRKGGAAIGGANAASYTIDPLVAGPAVIYDVVVTGGVGPAATSSGASVLVSGAVTPIITQDIPVASRTLYAGGAINLSVKAEGGSITYQWQTNGVDITGQTSAKLSLNNIGSTNAGVYRCVVRGSSGGPVNSAACTITLASPAAGSYEAVVAADGPETWWRMDDAPSATLMLDAMGRYDGSWLGGTVNLGVTGALTNNANKAANFDAVNQAWGEIGALPPPVANGDFTFECWVRPTDPLATESVPFSTFRPAYGFYFQKNGDGTWRGRDGYGDLDGNDSRQALIGTVTPGQWTHLVAMYSGAGGHRTYINGHWDGNSYVDFCRNLNIPMRIGALDPLQDYGLKKFFTGDIDEVAVYGKALTDAQVLSHYLTGLYSTTTPPVFAQQPQPQTAPIGSTANFATRIEGSPTIVQQWFRNGVAIANATNATLTLANVSYADAIGKTYQCFATNSSGVTPSAVVTLTVVPQPAWVILTNNLVLHLEFDGNFLDSSGKGHNATAVGTPTIVAGRVGSGALQYSTAVDDPTGHGGNVTAANYLTLGSFAPGSDLSFSNDVNFSVAYWIKTPTNTTSGDLPILCSANNSYGNAGLVFAPSYNAGGWSWSLGDGATYAGVYGAGGSIDNGSWHHVVHTFNRPAGQGITYLDGVQVSTVGISVLDNIDTGNVFNIGQDPSGAYPEAATNYLDDLAVWKGRVLTASEAYAAYYVGNSAGRSFDAIYPITIQLTTVDGANYIVWQAGTLQWADDVTGPYTAAPGANAPYYQITPNASKKFFRVHP